MSAFTALPLTKPMIKNLETLGYREMTPVQAESLPHVLKGEDLLAQQISLEHQGHIVVGTPGRIEQHLKRGTMNLDNVTTLVLDEADRMLDIGFSDSKVG